MRRLASFLGPSSLPARARGAVLAATAVSAISRRVGAGQGSVAGGHVGLALDPALLEHLAAGRRVALVSGTNGKTTTTRLLSVAVEGMLGTAATNSTGSNMPSGHVIALTTAPAHAPAVLEVDEGYVPRLVASLRPDIVLLLNLSRDQLDRTNEVRMVASKWRQAFEHAPGTVVVANADDPLVAWAASSAARVVWVGAGLAWRADAVGCPACEGRISFEDAPGGGWACECGFARMPLDVRLEDSQVVLAGGRRARVELQLPGRFNRANAVMAAAGAEALGVPWDESLRRMAGVEEVAGRFGVLEVGGYAVRMMLAKNPAGWRELLSLLVPGEAGSPVEGGAPMQAGSPVVVGINSRIADGRDPSWLWDVPFEQLRGREVVATGDRCRDLSVRLHYAEVPHRTVRDPVAAVRAAGLARARGHDRARTRTRAEDPHDSLDLSARQDLFPPIDFIGNYTAFCDVEARARAAHAPHAAPGARGSSAAWT